MAGDAHVAVCSPSIGDCTLCEVPVRSWTVSKKWTGKGTCFCFTTIIRTIPVHFLDKFSQVAEQTQQQGRRSINALRLCFTSAKNGGQCQSCHLSIMSITYVWWKNHQSNQHQSTFNRIPLTLHCHAPCPMSLTHAHWGSNSPNLDPPSISVADGFQSQQPARSRGKLWSKISILIINEKNTPRSPRFCLRKSRRLWWSESPAFCARLNRLSRLNCVEICLNLSAPSKRSRSKAHWPWPDKLHNFQNWSKQNYLQHCRDMSRYVKICRDMSRYVKMTYLIPSDTIWSPHWSQIFGNKRSSPPATRGVFASETENVSLSAQRPEGSDMALSDGPDGEKTTKCHIFSGNLSFHTSSSCWFINSSTDLLSHTLKIRRPRQTQGGARQGIILLTLVSDYYHFASYYYYFFFFFWNCLLNRRGSRSSSSSRRKK